MIQINMLTRIRDFWDSLHASGSEGVSRYSDETTLRSVQTAWIRRAITTLYLLFAYSAIVSIAFLILAYFHFVAPAHRDQEHKSAIAELAKPEIAKPEIAKPEAPKSEAKTSAAIVVPSPVPEMAITAAEPNSDANPPNQQPQPMNDAPINNAAALAADEKNRNASAVATWPVQADLAKPESWISILKRTDFSTFFLRDVSGKGSNEARVVMLTNYTSPQPVPDKDDVFLSQAYIIQINCASLQGGPTRLIKHSEIYLSGKEVLNSDLSMQQMQKKFDTSDPMYRLACTAGGLRKQ